MKKKKIIVIFLFLLVIAVLAIVLINAISSKPELSEQYFDKYEKNTYYSSMLPENYKDIERAYSLDDFLRFGSLNIGKLSNIPDDVTLLFKPKGTRIAGRELDETQDGWINLRLDEDKKNKRNLSLIELGMRGGVYNIYEYDDQKVVEVKSYEDYDEYKAEYSKIYKEGREKINESIKDYAGKRSWEEIYELLKVIHDYYQLHLLERSQATPTVSFVIYDGSDITYSNSTPRVFSVYEVVKGQGTFGSNLQDIYNQINPKKKHTVRFEYGDDGGIDEVIIERHLKRFLSFREEY